MTLQQGNKSGNFFLEEEKASLIFGVFFLIKQKKLLFSKVFQTETKQITIEHLFDTIW